MHMQAKRVTGVTLIELAIVISIIAVLTTMAMPALGSLKQSVVSRSARSALSVSINQARITAAMQSRQVVVCPSSNQADCEHNLRWQHGWISFNDNNKNGEHDADEDIVGITQGQPSGVAIVSTSGRHRIRYQADGTSDGSNLTLTVCDRRGVKSASTLVVSNSGRLRSGTPTPAQAATACASIGT